MAMPTPTLSSVTAEDAAARVRIEVQGSAPPGGVQAFEVERSTDGGVTWEQVRWVPTADDSHAAVLLDTEHPSVGEVTYRARAVDLEEEGEDPSAWSATETVEVDVQGWWLQDPQMPELDTQVNVDFADFTSVAREDQGVHYPLGNSVPTVVRGDARGEEFSIPFVFRGPELWRRFEALRRGQRTLLLRTEMGDVHYVAPGEERQVTVVRTADRAERPIRRVTMLLREVARP